MSQAVEFNWAVKSRWPERWLQRGRGSEVKGGYRVIPFGRHIELCTWNLSPEATVTITAVHVKRINDVSAVECENCGFSSLRELHEYVTREYPDSGGIVTLFDFVVSSNK